VLLNAIVTETTNAFEKDLLEDTYTDVSSSDFVEQLNNLDMPEMDFEREEDYHFVRNRGILETVVETILQRIETLVEMILQTHCNGHVDCHREVPQSIPLTAEGGQRATRLYRDTKQFCINGWENGNFDKSVTTASIDNDLYSAIQNQAIREAKSDHSKDGAVRYQESQPFAINNQNWELDTTESGTVVVGFPCVSQWWYTPIEVYDDIDDHVDRLVEGNAKKTRLQVYRRGDDWYCTFNIEYDTDTSGETPIGVDIGERHILAAGLRRRRVNAGVWW